MTESHFSDRKLLRRGKVRDIYDQGDELLIVATDRISAFDKVMSRGIPGKGDALTQLSEFWFVMTKHVFNNHYIEALDNRTLRVRKAERISIEWIARAYLYGSAWRAYSKGVREISGVRIPSGLQLAEELPEIILTPTTKSDGGHDQELTKQQALALKLVGVDEWKELEEATYRLYEYYRKVAWLKGIIIPDFKLEFGHLGDELIQIDEPPTHDSARFWARDKYRVGEKQEKHCLDKEFLRDYLMRVGFSGEEEPPELPDLLIDQISKRCEGAYEVISGKREIGILNLLSLEELMQQLQGTQ